VFSTRNIAAWLNSPQLLDAITKALEVREADEERDCDSGEEQTSSAEAIENTPLPETTKEGLLVSQELEWTRDLVLLKWHGTFDELHHDDGHENSDDDDVRQEDVRKSLADFIGHSPL